MDFTNLLQVCFGTNEVIFKKLLQFYQSASALLRYQCTKLIQQTTGNALIKVVRKGTFVKIIHPKYRRLYLFIAHDINHPFMTHIIHPFKKNIIHPYPDGWTPIRQEILFELIIPSYYSGLVGEMELMAADVKITCMIGGLRAGGRPTQVASTVVSVQ